MYPDHADHSAQTPSAHGAKVHRAAAAASPAASVAYTCPMHPEVVSDAPGRCPKCGMTLVPRDAKSM